jgi:hypothetical protein
MFDDDSGWESAEQVRRETATGGLYLSLQAGDKALVVFAGAPTTFRTVWIDGRSEAFDPKRHDGKRPSTRYAFPVLCPVTGAKEYTAHVWETSGQTFDAIRAARKKYGPRYLYEVTRTGSGKDTKYSVLPERELKDGEVEYLRSLDVPDVEALVASRNEPEPEAPTAEDPWKGDDGADW